MLLKKKIAEYIISSDSDREDSDEENSNKENFNEENYVWNMFRIIFKVF